MCNFCSGGSRSRSNTSSCSCSSSAAVRGQLTATVCGPRSCVNVGDFVMYTVCIKNTGSSSVNSISLADSSLTNGLSNVQYLSGNSWCPWTGSCTVSSLAPGCSTTVRIGGYVTSASGSTISNQISLRGNASVCWRDGSNGAVSTSLCSQPVCEPPTYPTGYNFPSHYPVLSGPDANGCYVYNIVALTPGYGLINYGLLDAFGNPIWSEVSCSGTAWPGGTCPQGCNC